MKSTLVIKDLVQTEELNGKAMSTVRGGADKQSNGTTQTNLLVAFAPMSVANGSKFDGSGPVNIQADSTLDQTASNYSYSENFKGTFGFGIPV